MKLSHIASAVALAAGAFVAGQASATTICQNCEWYAAGAPGTFIGAHDSFGGDDSGFRHSQMWVPVATAFNDVWVFDLAPQGAFTQINANFIPIQPTAFSGFNVAIRQVLTSTCPVTIANTLGTSGNCSEVTLGAVLATSVNAGANADVFPVALAAGRYAFQVSGTLNAMGTNPNGTNRFSQYSGQLTTSVIPEPGTLALAGLAMVGVAASLRRTRKA
jgi:PEP-CTERM motif